MEMVVFLRNDEQDDEMHWSMVESFEFDAFFGAAENGDDILDAVGKRVRNCNTGADPCADLGFARFKGTEDLVVAGFWDISAFGEQIHKFDDGRPMLGRIHIQKDVIRIE